MKTGEQSEPPDGAGTGARNWWDMAKEKAAQVLADVVPSWVKVDKIGNRVFVGHDLLVPALRKAIMQIDSVQLRELSVEADGYRARGSVRGREVGVLLVPRRLQWAAGQLSVQADTPGGVTSFDRSFATACVVAFATLFGGTAVVDLLTRPLTPAGVRWDGNSLTWETDIAGRVGAPEFARSVTGASLALIVEESGVWFVLEASHASLDVQTLAHFLGRLALNRAIGL